MLPKVLFDRWNIYKFNSKKSVREIHFKGYFEYSIDLKCKFKSNLQIRKIKNSSYSVKNSPYKNKNINFCKHSVLVFVVLFFVDRLVENLTNFTKRQICRNSINKKVIINVPKIRILALSVNEIVIFLYKETFDSISRSFLKGMAMVWPGILW